MIKICNSITKDTLKQKEKEAIVLMQQLQIIQINVCELNTRILKMYIDKN